MVINLINDKNNTVGNIVLNRTNIISVTIYNNNFVIDNYEVKLSRIIKTDLKQSVQNKSININDFCLFCEFYQLGRYNNRYYTN